MSRKKQIKRKPVLIKPSIEIGLDKLYTVQDLAQGFNINMTTIHRHIKKGRLIALHFGQTYYITERNLSAFLNSNLPVKSHRRK